MSLVDNKTEKWYQSRVLWLGVMQIAMSAVTAATTDVDAKTWVPAACVGLLMLGMRIIKGFKPAK